MSKEAWCKAQNIGVSTFDKWCQGTIVAKPSTQQWVPVTTATAIDMRKSINGLCAIVESSFQLDAFEKALFVFCNHQRDRLKILTWEDNGFWLHFKRLERGHFKWPTPGEDATMNLSLEELSHLIKSPGVEQKL